MDWVSKLTKNSATTQAQIVPTLNPLSASFTKWSNTLRQFVGKLPTIADELFECVWPFCGIGA